MSAVAWRSGRSRDGVARVTGLADVAATVERLAVLVSAGVPPGAAWRHLDDDPIAALTAPVASVGGDVPDAIASAAPPKDAASASAVRGLAAAWLVATDTGAPMAAALRSFGSSLRAFAATQRDIATALTAPKATARVVLVLPAVGVLFGMVLGFDTIGVLVTTPVGWICLAIGAILLALGWLWMRSLVRRAALAEATPGLRCDLIAIAVSGGGPLQGAVDRVDSAMRRFQVGSDDAALVDRVLALSARAGVPAADLLRSEAEEARREATAAAQQQAEALAVRLMLPLGLCVLPSFIVLGVVPLIAAVLSSTLGGL
jgi:tight adherence protein B